MEQYTPARSLLRYRDIVGLLVLRLQTSMLSSWRCGMLRLAVQACRPRYYSMHAPVGPRAPRR